MSLDSAAPSASTSTDAEREQKKLEKKARKQAKKEAKAAATAAAASAAAGDETVAADIAEPAPAAEQQPPAVEADDKKAEKKKSKKDKKRKLAETFDEAEPELNGTATEVEEPKPKKEKKDKKSKKTKVDPSSEPVASASAAPPAPSLNSTEVAAFVTENNIIYDPPETATSHYPPVLSFASLPLDSGLRKGLSGYEKPTPIQSASFPVMMAGRDVIGIAETG